MPLQTAHSRRHAAPHVVAILLLLLSSRSFQVESLALPVGIDHEVRQNSPAAIPSCVLNGNSDLYGLGIRLGVYFQLISTLLANHFLPDALREAWDANTLFLVSIFIAVIKSSVNVNNLAASEAFLMLQMLFTFLVAVYHVRGSFKWQVFEILTQMLDGTVNSGLGWLERMSKLGRARRDVSNLGITMRQFLALAIASYNVWFWFTGSDFLDSGQHCSSSIFFFAQVNLHGHVTVFFQVLGVLYLLFQVCQSARSFDIPFYLFMLCFRKIRKNVEGSKPTLRFFWGDIFSPISLVKRAEARGDEQNKPQRHVFDNQPLIRSYLPRLNRTGRSRKHDKRLNVSRVVRILWHTTTFAASLFFIAWSVAAIELTLTWNHAQGVYSISSTGQLIPFIVGLAGLLKTLFSLFTIIWKKSRQKHKPEVQKDSAIWKYRLSEKRCAIFDVQPPDRRWSFDETTLRYRTGSRKAKPTRFDRLAPVYPILKEDENTRRSALSRIVVQEPYWDEGRWFYLTKGKNLHIFHNIPMRRRKSLGDLESLQRSGAPKPHPARPRALLPLSQKKEYEESELKRTHWYWNQRLKLGKAWGSKKRNLKLRLRPSKDTLSLDGDSDREGCFWLPDDVDPGLFSSVSMVAPATDMGHPKSRRWSFDQNESAYPDFGSPSHRYPFLTGRDWQTLPARTNGVVLEPGVYVPRTDSFYTSSNSTESSIVSVGIDRTRTSRSTSPRRSRSLSPFRPTFRERTPAPSPSLSSSRKSHHPEQKKTWHKVLHLVANTFACIFNTLFLCAPFTALTRKLRKDHTARSRSKRFPPTPSHIRRYPSGQLVMFKHSSSSSRSRTRCKDCDLNFDVYDRRRRWTRLTAEAQQNRSLEKAGWRYVFSWKYTADVVWGLIRPWVKGTRWVERLKALVKYELEATLDKDEEDDEMERGAGRGRVGGE